jgi:hypothetical protein
LSCANAAGDKVPKDTASRTAFAPGRRAREHPITGRLRGCRPAGREAGRRPSRGAGRPCSPMRGRSGVPDHRVRGERASIATRSPVPTSGWGAGRGNRRLEPVLGHPGARQILRVVCARVAATGPSCPGSRACRPDSGRAALGAACVAGRNDASQVPRRGTRLGGGRSALRRRAGSAPQGARRRCCLTSRCPTSRCLTSPRALRRSAAAPSPAPALPSARCWRGSGSGSCGSAPTSRCG